MLQRKGKKELKIATYAAVKYEIAKPRMSRSARIAELNLDTARNIEQPSTIMPRTGTKIIAPHKPTGKGTDCRRRGAPLVSRDPHRKYAN
jgi:hypothetical protein